MESEEIQAVEAIEPTALEALTRGEVDIQVATARRWPRDLANCQKRAKAMATADSTTAEAMWYSLPARKGSDSKEPIQGPSVRLAEILVVCWGNLRAQARVIDVGATHVVAMGQAWDLENNVAVSVEARRKVVGKGGARYGPEMIQRTADAACSVAFRNAVFKIVPRTYTDALLREARAFSAKSAPIETRRERMVARFATLGVSEAQLLEHLELEKIEQVEADHITQLGGLFNAIKEGAISAEEVFGGGAKQEETPRVTMPRAEVKVAADETPEETAER